MKFLSSLWCQFSSFRNRGHWCQEARFTIFIALPFCSKSRIRNRVLGAYSSPAATPFCQDLNPDCRKPVTGDAAQLHFYRCVFHRRLKEMNQTLRWLRLCEFIVLFCLQELEKCRSKCVLWGDNPPISSVSSWRTEEHDKWCDPNGCHRNVFDFLIQVLISGCVLTNLRINHHWSTQISSFQQRFTVVVNLKIKNVNLSIHFIYFRRFWRPVFVHLKML
jgi:hypothetical protein